MDNLITCKRCGGNACLKGSTKEKDQDIEIDTFFCFGCGFTTTSANIPDSPMISNILETAPELYKDLKFIDEQGLVWLPATVTLPKVGMVFIDGTNQVDWQWAAVKAIPIPPDEISKYPEGQTHKMDMKNARYFGKRDFMDALDEIGFFKVD